LSVASKVKKATVAREVIIFPLATGNWQLTTGNLFRLNNGD
jgi:hypothetical protein